MRLATIRTESGTSAVRIDGDAAVECGASDVGTLLASADWRARAGAADGPPHPLADQAQRLRLLVELEQEELATALEKLDAEQWATEVVTAQGRHVTAATLPWLRTRELWMHATDLCDAADFSEFPPVLLDDLIVDVLRRRADTNGEIVLVRPTDHDRTPPFDGPAPPVWIEGRSADLARWLTGRGATTIHTSDDSALPTLRPWL